RTGKPPEQNTLLLRIPPANCAVRRQKVSSPYPGRDVFSAISSWKTRARKTVHKIRGQRFRLQPQSVDRSCALRARPSNRSGNCEPRFPEAGSGEFPRALGASRTGALHKSRRHWFQGSCPVLRQRWRESDPSVPDLPSTRAELRRGSRRRLDKDAFL